MNLKCTIEKLRQSGDLFEIDRKVDWKYEIGAICRKKHNSPCLFTNIKDYKGFSLFTGGFSSFNSICTVLGVNGKHSFKEINRVVKDRLNKREIPHIVDKTCTHYGFMYSPTVNLFHLPVPWWDKRDCGRYIGTWHANITKDIESQKRNVGIYRMMIIDENHTTISVSKNSHLAQQFLSAEKNGMDLEMVTAIGTQEQIVMAASAAVPYGSDEFEIAGAILCQPVLLGMCETITLEYPVESEIILEGRIKAGLRVTDGPFADYTGIPSSNKNALLYEITAMYCKERCVFRGMAVGKPGAEDHRLLSILASNGMMNFHGSKYKNSLQAMFLRHQLFTLFQLSGRTMRFK
jgi:4-hydroxy-3-polyprenylbenzoate decarboxylase